MVMITWDTTNKGTGVSLSNNNLTAKLANENNMVRASLGKDTGKWYWEIKVDITNYSMIGISNLSATLNASNYTTQDVRYYYAFGGKYPSGASYGSTYINNDVIGVALDLDNGKLEFYKNGVSQGVAYTDIKSMGEVFPAIGTASGSSEGSTVTANFGSQQFKYAIPSGYKPYDFQSTNKILLLSNNETYSIEKGGYSENLVPIMTSNTAPSGVVSASSNHANYPPYFAFNKSINPDNRWVTLNGNRIGWISYKFNNPIKIKNYALTSVLVSSEIGQNPKDWTFEGSEDGIKWDILDTQDNVTDWGIGEKRLYQANNHTEYLYYRINVTENNGHLSYLSIAEIEMFGSLEINRLPSSSQQNLIKYGMDSPIQVDGIFESKNYILQDTVSENEDGLWTTQLNRKPLSIRFD